MIDSNVKKRKRVFTGCPFLVILYLLASSTQLAGAELTNIVVRKSANELLIDIKLKGVFTEEMKVAVSKGIPVDIAFSVSLYEVHNFWFDRKMISRTAIHRIQFDTLKKEYKVRRSWEKRDFRAEKDSEEAQRILSEIKGLKVIPLSLIDMINTMLDITEAEAGVNGTAEEEFDLAAMITDACELFRPVADQKRIELNCNMPKTLLFRGVRKKMQRVVTNLLENAIKYTPEHGSVTISVVANGSEIQIDFKDNGIGISEEDLPHIFDRFYRCDRSRTQGGVGLGLSLAKAFAVSMQGMIQVNSSINQGSTFTLKFAQ